MMSRRSQRSGVIRDRGGRASFVFLFQLSLEAKDFRFELTILYAESIPFQQASYGKPNHDDSDSPDDP